MVEIDLSIITICTVSNIDKYYGWENCDYQSESILLLLRASFGFSFHVTPHKQACFTLHSTRSKENHMGGLYPTRHGAQRQLELRQTNKTVHIRTMLQVFVQKLSRFCIISYILIQFKVSQILRSWNVERKLYFSHQIFSKSDI